MSFQVAWELTLKCNMDCTYCADGHDNSTDHTEFSKCLDTIDFILEYINVQLSNRKHKIAGLNIQGGESLHHPKIVEILKYINLKKQDYKYNLSVALITNLVAGSNTISKIVPNVDFFTVSYHAEMLPKQLDLFKQNLLKLKSADKNFNVKIMMHPSKWSESIDMIDFCETNDLPYYMSQIDHHWMDTRFYYSKEQIKYITGKDPINFLAKLGSLSSQDRGCCGGNSFCVDGCEVKRVSNKFKNWYCTVDKYFLYVRQYTGEVFTNKDCRMNWDGGIGAIGSLDNTAAIIDKVKKGTPVIQCKKSKCWCGICAPKSKQLQNLQMPAG